MKRALIIAAVTIASTSAFASKARMTALGNAAHLSDVQDVISKPDKAAGMGEWATMEFGSTAGANTRAEGGFVRMMGQSAMGAYLGSVSGTATSGVLAYRNFTPATGLAYLPQENPIRLFYATKAGDMNWGVGLYHSSSKKKPNETSERKQDTTGLTASASGDVWDAQLGLGLGNTATSSNGTSTQDNKMTGKTTMSLGGGYKMDTMYIYGKYASTGAKTENGTTTDMDRADTSTTIGIINSHKKDGADFFYGISYTMATLKDDAAAPAATSLGAGVKKNETNTMPIIVGIEAEATSWMVLRGAVTQDFNLLGMSKTKTENTTSANNTENTGIDNTTISAGVGVKWNKFTWDTTVTSASANGAAFGTDAANFLARSGLTYNF